MTIVLYCNTTHTHPSGLFAAGSVLALDMILCRTLGDRPPDQQPRFSLTPNELMNSEFASVMRFVCGPLCDTYVWVGCVIAIIKG